MEMPHKSYFYDIIAHYLKNSITIKATQTEAQWRRGESFAFLPLCETGKNYGAARLNPRRQRLSALHLDYSIPDPRFTNKKSHPAGWLFLLKYVDNNDTVSQGFKRFHQK